MVQNPNIDPKATPPAHPGATPPAQGAEKKKAAGGGQFEFTKEHKFLGMTFEAKDWNKLMNIMLRNMSDFINKTFQKMTDKMKEDWKRGAGEDS